jgi:hypothetical protein
MIDCGIKRYGGEYSANAELLLFSDLLAVLGKAHIIVHSDTSAKE